MEILAGTSGFSYKEWKGPFYPDKLPDKDMLGFYATKLPVVEINNTFYRMPKRDVIRAWASETPDHFRFVIKASRRITHFKRLKDTDEQMSYLLTNTAELGPKLGAILFQLPPNMRSDLERLKAFVGLIPESVRAAIEFRHQSWFDDSVFQCLRDNNVAICHADGDDDTLPFVATANWGYLRLRKPAYDLRALKKWRKTAVDANWKQAYVFFKHEDEAAGPKLAMKFAALAP